MTTRRKPYRKIYPKNAEDILRKLTNLECVAIQNSQLRVALKAVEMQARYFGIDDPISLSKNAIEPVEIWIEPPDDMPLIEDKLDTSIL